MQDQRPKTYAISKHLATAVIYITVYLASVGLMTTLTSCLTLLNDRLEQRQSERQP